MGVSDWFGHAIKAKNANWYTDTASHFLCSHFRTNIKSLVQHTEVQSLIFTLANYWKCITSDMKAEVRERTSSCKQVKFNANMVVEIPAKAIQDTTLHHGIPITILNDILLVKTRFRARNHTITPNVYLLLYAGLWAINIVSFFTCKWNTISFARHLFFRFFNLFLFFSHLLRKWVCAFEPKFQIIRRRRRKYTFLLKKKKEKLFASFEEDFQKNHYF